MGFDVLNCDNRFGDSEIPIVVLGFDKVLTWTKNSRNQISSAIIVHLRKRLTDRL